MPIILNHREELRINFIVPDGKVAVITPLILYLVDIYSSLNALFRIQRAVSLLADVIIENFLVIFENICYNKFIDLFNIVNGSFISHQLARAVSVSPNYSQKEN